MEFWSTDRLWEHLRRRPACLIAHTESDHNFGTVVHQPFSAEVKPATALIGPQPFWAILSPCQPERPQLQASQPNQLEKWQRKWDEILNGDSSHRNPKTLSTLLHNTLPEEGWQMQVAHALQWPSSFGDLCRTLHHGSGMMLGFRVLSKGSAWAICRQELQDVAASAVCF